MKILIVGAGIAGLAMYRKLLNTDHTSYLVGKSDAFMFYPIADNKLYCYGQISDPENKYKNIDSNQYLKMCFQIITQV